MPKVKRIFHKRKTNPFFGGKQVLQYFIKFVQTCFFQVFLYFSNKQHLHQKANITKLTLLRIDTNKQIEQHFVFRSLECFQDSQLKGGLKIEEDCVNLKLSFLIEDQEHQTRKNHSLNKLYGAFNCSFDIFAETQKQQDCDLTIMFDIAHVILPQLVVNIEKFVKSERKSGKKGEYRLSWEWGWWQVVQEVAQGLLALAHVQILQSVMIIQTIESINELNN